MLHIRFPGCFRTWCFNLLQQPSRCSNRC